VSRRGIWLAAAALAMTPRARRRNRSIDVERAYQRAGHAANPRRLQATTLPLDLGAEVRVHVPPERANQIALLNDAAWFRGAYRRERAR
jgi:hypothetical protein